MSLLDEALARDGKNVLQPGKTVLIKDNVSTSGAFMLHFFVKRVLQGLSDSAMLPSPKSENGQQSGGIVLFLGFKEPFSHYDRVLRKLGCNLSAFRNSGQFIFLNLSNFSCTGVKTAKTDNPLFEVYKCIHQSLQKIVESGIRAEHISVMIDDVSILEVKAHGSEPNVLNFLHYCSALTTKQGCSLVLLVHHDIYADLDSPNLMQHLEHSANIVIDVEPLFSGLATDVHGQLIIFHRTGQSISDSHKTQDKRLHFLHFQLKENKVECFLPGKQI